MAISIRVSMKLAQTFPCLLSRRKVPFLGLMSSCLGVIIISFFFRVNFSWGKSDHQLKVDLVFSTFASVFQSAALCEVR